MSANIHGTMVYSFEKPMWHNITEPSHVSMGAVEILEKKFGGAFPIILRPVTVTLNGVAVETGDFAIVRGNSPHDGKGELVFGYCTKRYLPLQPREVAQSFDNNVKEPAETMAFLGDGEEMFISWVMPTCEVQTITGLDVVQMYGIVRLGFDTLKGARLFTSTFRPVCSNTVNFAQAWAEAHTDGKGTGMIFKGKATNHNLLRDLGYWMEHVQGHALKEVNTLRDFFGLIAKTPVKNDAEVHEVLYTAFPPKRSVSEYIPKQLATKSESETLEYNAGQTEIRDGIARLFGGDGTAITPDYYGIFNATSEYFCHVQPSKRPISESVMFGARQSNTMKVVNVLRDRAS
jgi:hypothetical protein